MDISGSYREGIGMLEMGSGRFPRIPIVSRNLSSSCDCSLLLHQSYPHATPAVRAVRIQHSHLICQSHSFYCKAELNFLCCHNPFPPMHIPPSNIVAALLPQLNSGPTFTATPCQAALAVGKSNRSNCECCFATCELGNWHT